MLPAHRVLIGERGGSASIEATLLVPVLMLILFGGFQAATWWQGRQTVLAAAQSACEQARTHQPGDAHATGQRVLDRAKIEGTVTIVTTGATVTCTATGRTNLIVPLPGLSGRYTEAITMPKEGV